MKAYEIFYDILLNQKRKRGWTPPTHPDLRINDIDKTPSPMQTLEAIKKSVNNWRISAYTTNDEVQRGAEKGFGQDIDDSTGIGIRDFVPAQNALEKTRKRQKEKCFRIVTGANADLGFACIEQAAIRGLSGLAGMRNNRFKDMMNPLKELSKKTGTTWAFLPLDIPKRWSMIFKNNIPASLTAIEVVNAAAYHIMDKSLSDLEKQQKKFKVSDDDVLNKVLAFTGANTGLPIELSEAIENLRNKKISRVAWVDIGTTDTRGSKQVLTTKFEAEKAVRRTLSSLEGHSSYAAVQAGRVATRALALTNGAEIPIEHVVDVVEACFVFATCYSYIRPEVTVLSSKTYKKIATNTLKTRSGVLKL